MKYLKFTSQIVNFSLKHHSTTHHCGETCWKSLKSRAIDPIYGLVEQFKMDKAKHKVNLTQGTYKDHQGNPFKLNSVREAEKLILEKKYDHEYLPIEGYKPFVEKSLELAYSGLDVLKSDKIAALQTISGTGALSIGIEFLRDFHPNGNEIYLSNLSWPNHVNVFSAAGVETKYYRYYDNENLSFDYNGMIQDLDRMPDGSVVLLHVCAHNPTGILIYLLRI
jgi:aspartate aminotransferase, mitochondrial